MQRTAKTRVEDGWELAIKQQTQRVSQTILKPWAPVEVNLSSMVIPGMYDVLIIGSKSIQERLGIDITTFFNDNFVKGVKKTIIPDELAEAGDCYEGGADKTKHRVS